MITITLDNIFATLSGEVTDNVRDALYDFLSYETEDSKYVTIYGADTKTRLYQRKRQKFPVGLISDVEKYFQVHSIKYNVIDTITVPEKYNYYMLKTPFYDLYDHQKKIMDEIKTRPRNAISSATGSGKSLVIMAAANHWGVNTLVITPSLGLVKQLRADFELHFGKKVVGGHKDDKQKEITICNIQGIQKKDQAWFDHYEAIVIDEVHHASSKTYFALNKKFMKHISYRLFMSATLFRNDGHGMKLKGITGDTCFTYTAKQAIEDGVIVKPKFFIYNIKHEYVPSMGFHQDYSYHLEENVNRNNKVVEITNKIIENTKNNLLILTQRVEHCHKLSERIPGSVVVTGKVKQSRQILEDYKLGKFQTLIATSGVLGEGIDLPNIDVLIIVGGYKSEILINQLVGRVVRRDDERGKTKGLVVDFYDANQKILEKHSKIRIKIYKETFYEEDVKVIE